MISQKDIHVGDKVLVNWNEYRKYHKSINPFSLGFTQYEWDDPEFTVDDIYRDGEAYARIVGKISIRLPLRFLHKIY